MTHIKEIGLHEAGSQEKTAVNVQGQNKLMAISEKITRKKLCVDLIVPYKYLGKRGLNKDTVKPVIPINLQIRRFI